MFRTSNISLQIRLLWPTRTSHSLKLLLMGNLVRHTNLTSVQQAYRFNQLEIEATLQTAASGRDHHNILHYLARNNNQRMT